MTVMPFFTRCTYFLLCFILLIFVLMQGEQLFIPLTFSVIFAFIALPMSDRMENLKFPRWLAAMLSIIFIALIVVGFIVFFSYQVSQFADDLPMIKAKLNEKILDVQKYIRQNMGYSVTEQNKWINKQLDSNDNSTGSYLMGFFATTTQLLANATLIPIMVFFLLLYRDRFKTFVTLIDQGYHTEVLSVISQVGKVSQMYLKGLFFDIVILSALNAIGFMFFKVQYAILFAILAAVLNIIPYIGVIIGGIIPMVIVLVTQDNSLAALGVLAVTVVVQFIDNNIIYPKIVGSSVSINPLMSIIVLIIGNFIWGTTGMILALPLAGMLKVVLDSVEWLRPYGYLMGEEEKIERPSRFLTKEKMASLRQALLGRR